MFDVEKVASADETEQILSQIYYEKPAFWSNGLTKQHFDGGLWLIRKQASREAVGFVGWQERSEAAHDGRLQKVGYYSIGILPEARGNGYARKAVSQVIREKSAGVDIVRALVHPDNVPSIRLAEKLGVDILKEAAAAAGGLKSLIKQLAGYGAAGGASSTFWDQVAHPDAPLSESLQPWKWDKHRQLMGGLNAALGVGGAALGRHGIKTNSPEAVAAGVGTFALAPAKDALMAAMPLMSDARKAMADGQSKSTQIMDLLRQNGRLNIGAALAGVLGAGVLGYAGYRGAKALKGIADTQTGGTAELTLPTKDPGDVETKLRLPIGQIRLSNNILQGLGRDTRRRLRTEGSGRKKVFQGEQARAKNLGINMNDAGEVTKGEEAA